MKIQKGYRLLMNNELPAALTHVFERSAHPYHMWDGIQSIPAGMEDILSPQVAGVVRASAAAMRTKLPIHLMGCGTSYFAAHAIAQAIQQVAGLPAYAWEAFELMAYPPVELENSSLVGISHTGGTPPVVRAIELARERGACTVGYTDGVPSALGRSSEWVVASTLGAELALPKTRSYLASLMRGYLHAVELGRLNGKDVSAVENALRGAPALGLFLVAVDYPDALAAEPAASVASAVAAGLDLPDYLDLFLACFFLFKVLAINIPKPATDTRRSCQSTTSYPASTKALN